MSALPLIIGAWLIVAEAYKTPMAAERLVEQRMAPLPGMSDL
eukprot:CAMPEP_0179072040 /NCGR_PEP_ID=MMETSP0796-20121207/31845_1 /TAXON_ID=73915 /ORGANISM="Pyrodinium bahamense, Strain pbaha01" /LENGTH=41 /DNA_ID= /DNA_START= /DNA_END= /DNA_ORIENTATION=